MAQKIRDLMTSNPLDAVRLMEDRAARRLLVVEGDTAVGIVTMGDLAVARDPDSALAQVSAAPANR